MKDREEEWQELCKRAAIEQDPQELLKLTGQICELLDAKNRRLRGQRTGDDAQDRKRVFQIAYDESLLVTRAELLKVRGYDVVSVLGNDAAKRLLDENQRYRLFIVGHDATHETRKSMVQWLKTNFPKTKILALTGPYDSMPVGADYSVPLNGPEQWLAAVESAVS